MNTDYENGVTVMTNGTAPRADVASVLSPEPAPAPPEVKPVAPAPAAPVREPAAPAQGVAPSAQVEPKQESTGEETPPAPIVRHNQDYAQQLKLIELRNLVDGVESVPEPLHALLEAQGITSAYLATCRSYGDLQDAAIATRRQAIANKILAVQEQERADAFARFTYAALRKVTRTLLRNTADEIALGLDEEVPVRTDLFLTTARHAVATAKQEPYASLLAGATVGADRLEAMEGALDALTTLIHMRQNAEQAAIEATRARNAAADDVRRAARQLRVEIGAVLRQHPEITPPVWFRA